MVRIFFRESYCLRAPRVGAFYNTIMIVALVVAVLSGMLTLMLGLAFIIGYPDEGTVKLFLEIVATLIGSLAIFTACRLKYREASRVEVREDGLLLGNKRIVKWNEIDDMKFLTETHVDLEVEGGPVMGYGMHGYGMYGYTPSRSVTRHVYRYMSVQIFHRHGVDELCFTPTSFWRFVKAVLQAIKDKHELLADRSWPQKLIRLDRAL